MTKTVQTMVVPTVIDSIMVVGALTCWALLHSVYNLKASDECATPSNLGIYEFELGHNAKEVTKNTVEKSWKCS